MLWPSEGSLPSCPEQNLPPSPSPGIYGYNSGLCMEARLPLDKLCNAPSLLTYWASKQTCHPHDIQSLIGTLQFACRVISPGRPFMQRIINLTWGISSPKKKLTLTLEFRKDILMWQFFLQQWNGVSLFLPPFTQSSKEIHLFTDAAGAIEYRAFFDNQWFHGKWLPTPISSILLPVSALPGRSSTKFT